MEQLAEKDQEEQEHKREHNSQGANQRSNGHNGSCSWTEEHAVCQDTNDVSITETGDDWC